LTRFADLEESHPHSVEEQHEQRDTLLDRCRDLLADECPVLLGMLGCSSSAMMTLTPKVWFVSRRTRAMRRRISSPGSRPGRHLELLSLRDDGCVVCDDVELHSEE